MGVISIGMILGFEVKGKFIRPHTVKDFGRKGFVDSLTPGKCSAKETRSVCLIKKWIALFLWSHPNSTFVNEESFAP